MTSSIREVISRFENSSVLVIGDFMIDEYIKGTVERISPEAPVPVVQEVETIQLPGGAGNVVCNLNSLGSQVILAGLCGKDAPGAGLKKMFLKLGLKNDDIFLFEASDRPTTIKTRIMAGNQQLCRLDREKKLPLTAELEKELKNFISRNINKIQAVIFSDYDKGVVTPEIIKFTVELAKEKNIFIAVDPQVTHFDYYKNVDVLTPNHHEAGRFLHKELKSDDEVNSAGIQINSLLNSSMILITRGEKGMTLVESDKNCRHFPTRAREVFDVTGAGDTVISIFTLAMISGANRELAVHMSNTGAGIVVGRIGAATITQKELLEQMEA